ncbi:winged helix-turn-helix transcriptional regulator [Streptomyces sp. NPDC058051]
MRCNELRRVLDGITQRMLLQTPRAPERDGLVSRTAHPTVPPGRPAHRDASEGFSRAYVTHAC